MLPTDKVRQGVNTVIPGRLYQRGSYLTWPHSTKHQLIEALGISMIVSLWYPIDSDLATQMHDRLYVSWHIATNRVPQDANAMVNLVVSVMQHGGRVLVNCEAGHNRSAWFCARIVRKLLGVTGAEAWAIVKRGVPNAQINKAFMEDILNG